MTDPIQLPPQAPEPSQKSKGELIEELGGLVSNDTEAPYSTERTSSVEFSRGKLRTSGSFPTTVALFIISTLGTVFVLSGEASTQRPYHENLSYLGVIYGATLAAQGLENRKK